MWRFLRPSFSAAAAFVVVVVLMWATALDGPHPARAATTEIVVGLSNTQPTRFPSPAFFAPGTTLTLHVWAKDVTDPTGLAAFNIGFRYPSDIMAIDSIQYQTSFLTSTGRIALCAPVVNDPDVEPGVGRVVAGCSTISPQNYLGPQGTGLLATITLRSLGMGGIVTLTFPDETFLVNRGSTTGGVIVPPQVIPATVTNTVFYVSECGDFDGDHIVSIQDLLRVGVRYGMNSGMPDWDPIYDLNLNNSIDLVDILLTARQYGYRC